MKLAVIGLLLAIGSFAHAAPTAQSFNCSFMSGGSQPEEINSVIVKATSASKAQIVAAVQGLKIVDEDGSLASKDQAEAPMARGWAEDVESVRCTPTR